MPPNGMPNMQGGPRPNGGMMGPRPNLPMRPNGPGPRPMMQPRPGAMGPRPQLPPNGAAPRPRPMVPPKPGMEGAPNPNTDGKDPFATTPQQRMFYQNLFVQLVGAIIIIIIIIIIYNI